MQFGVRHYFVWALTIATLVPGSMQTNYCKINPQHTMCLHQTDHPGKACPNTFKLVEAKTITPTVLETHNKYRSDVASGKYESKNCANAADMILMSWDEELAEIAARHVSQCKFEHDKNRDVDRFNVGQNIYSSSGRNRPEIETMKSAINMWFSEIDDLNPAFKSNTVFTATNLNVGHFTQIVWSNSFQIGCAMSTYGNTSLVACNYGPAGNMLGTRVYSIGRPCSECPDGIQCSVQYHSLCGNSNSIKANKMNTLIQLLLITFYILRMS